jgi:hypothetical protein
MLAMLGCSARRNGTESAARSHGDAARLAEGLPDDARGAPGETSAPSAPSELGAASGSGGASALLVVDDPTALAALEENGANLFDMLGGATAGIDGQMRTSGRTGSRSNAVLVEVPRYASLLRVLEADLGEIARTDPNAGVSVARSSHRLFDARWLRSPAARFELVGLVNRLDRAGIVGGCGEVRLVYRLAYVTDVNGSHVASRLPMTISLELLALSDDGSPEVSTEPARPGAPTDRRACRLAAERWSPPTSAREGTMLARWLLSERGPLSAVQRASTAIRRVAVNMQSVRWPSTVRPDLGGHAEYLLRAFADDGAGKLVPAPLENTLDVARVRRGTPLFNQLLAWVNAAEHLADIDAATITLPEALSAKRAVSVTPRGLSRLKNRPFSSVLRAGDIAQSDLAPTRNSRSPAALLRRLDDLTCPGCHESRSVAGFHFLGIDREGTSPSNAVSTAFSPHFSRDQPRRREVVEAMRAGRALSYARPLAERAAQGDAGYGAHCGLGDAGFSDWTCDPGYRCERFDAPDNDATVGICLPLEGADVGDPCEFGPLAPSSDPLRDRIARVHTSPCSAGAVCNTNAVGFPGGMCTASCTDLPRRGACGAIAVLDAFNACLAANESFETCISAHSSPAGLRRCNADEPCRDDYICAGSGVCIPPYFVFQMRVDGHPVPPRE